MMQVYVFLKMKGKVKARATKAPCLSCSPFLLFNVDLLQGYD